MLERLPGISDEGHLADTHAHVRLIRAATRHTGHSVSQTSWWQLSLQNRLSCAEPATLGPLANPLPQNVRHVTQKLCFGPHQWA